MNYDRAKLNLEKIVFVLKKDWRPPELHAGMPREAAQVRTISCVSKIVKQAEIGRTDQYRTWRSS